MTQPQEYVRKNGDFVDVLVHTSKIKVLNVKYIQSQQYGTTYSVTFQILDTPEVAGLWFICKVNSKYSKEYKEKYNKTPANTVGMLADYLGIDHKTFKDMVKASNNVGIEQAIIHIDKLIKVSAKFVPQSPNQPPYAKVFNIATELHTTVTFTEIRDTLVEYFHLPIAKGEFDGMKEPNTYIVEDTIKGEMVWSIYQSRSELMGETFDSTIEINSGKNTKQDAIDVIAKIKIGSCDNSIKVAIEMRILRVGEWKARLLEYLTKGSRITQSIL